MSLSMHRVLTPLGTIQVLQSDLGVACLSLGEAGAQKRFDTWRRRYAPAEALGSDPLRGAVAEQLDEYFAGKRDRFTVPLDLRGTAFQLRVWQALIAIPKGSVCTYGELARTIGVPNGSRAVGGANGRNPVPLFVPCHRVVARVGLGGFSGPPEWKQGLLALEGACLSP